MKRYLLYQLILTCSLMICQSYCTTTSGEEKAKIMNDKDALDELGLGKYHYDDDDDDDDDVQFNSIVDMSRYRYVAHVREYPYHVAIIAEIDNSVLCQGALVTPKWMLTSGTCFRMYYTTIKDSICVVAGVVNTKDHRAIFRDIKSGIFHPEFEHRTGTNDLALVELNDTIIDDSGRVKTIELSNVEYPPGTHCTYTVFENEFILYAYTLNLLELSKCDAVPDLPNEVLKYHCMGIGDLQFLTDINLEAQLTHVGTPLVCGNKLYGIKTEDGVFTATNDIKSWVDSVIQMCIYRNIFGCSKY